MHVFIIAVITVIIRLGDIVMGVDYKLIGSRIKLKRREMGMTQDALAERLSVTVGYVSQLERGVTKISLDMLGRIAAELECDLSYFVSGAAEDQAAYLSDEMFLAFSSLNQKQRRFIIEFIELLKKNS